MVTLALFASVPALAQEGHNGHHAHASASAPPTPAASLPSDHAADLYYDPAAMRKARLAMTKENGGMRFSQIMVDRLEYRLQGGGDLLHWEGEGWIGGDIHRLAFRTKGDAEVGGKLDHGEVQALYSRAIDPWFNLDAGVRQDFGATRDTTYAVLGVSGLAPYWFEVEASAFLSDEGRLHARLEGNYDQRLTQRLILQPAIELNISAQDVPEQRIGSGVTNVELGVRLRYEVAREFAPYVGINWERRYGDTARFARLSGENPASTSFVMGARFWF